MDFEASFCELREWNRCLCTPFSAIAVNSTPSSFTSGVMTIVGHQEDDFGHCYDEEIGRSRFSVLCIREPSVKY